MSTENISQTATDVANIAIVNKYKVACGLSIGILTLALAYSKGQGRAHFDCEYLANDYSYDRHCNYQPTHR